MYQSRPVRKDSYDVPSAAVPEARSTVAARPPLLGVWVIVTCPPVTSGTVTPPVAAADAADGAAGFWVASAASPDVAVLATIRPASIAPPAMPPTTLGNRILMGISSIDWITWGS